MKDNLIERLSDEAEFCKQVGVFSIAKLLDEACAAIERQSVPAGFDEWAKSQGYGPSMLRTHAQAGWNAALAAPQPQPVQPQGPMAETVEEAARDVAKCLNERDGQGLDLRHVAMLVHYAQQPVQEPVKGWWAHTCPEDGKVDVVNYQLTPADKRAGWVEHEVYTSPQAKPTQPLSDEQIDAIAGPGPDYFDRKVFARAIEQAHGIKGTT